MKKYFDRVHAHRLYQLTITQYKALKYGQSRKDTKFDDQQDSNENPQLLEVSKYFKWTWSDVYDNIDEVIKMYRIIRVEAFGLSQPIFIDLIIRLLIAKSHIVSIQHKPIKAANCLNKAEKKIRKIGTGQHQLISNSHYPELRPDTYCFPIEILQQKYLMQRGFWAKIANNPYDALVFFNHALSIQNLYDPRIHRECLLQMREILTDRQLSVSKIDLRLHNFIQKPRDIVLLVDHSDLQSLTL